MSFSFQKNKTENVFNQTLDKQITPSVNQENLTTNIQQSTDNNNTTIDEQQKSTNVSSTGLVETTPSIAIHTVHNANLRASIRLQPEFQKEVNYSSTSQYSFSSQRSSNMTMTTSISLSEETKISKENLTDSSYSDHITESFKTQLFADNLQNTSKSVVTSNLYLLKTYEETFDDNDEGEIRSSEQEDPTVIENVDYLEESASSQWSAAFWVVFVILISCIFLIILFKRRHRRHYIPMKRCNSDTYAA